MQVWTLGLRHSASMDALMSVSKKRSKCVNCLSEHHSAGYCTEVTNVVECKAILRKHARCFICLNLGHRAADCRQCNILCTKCKGKHQVFAMPVQTLRHPSQQRKLWGIPSHPQQRKLWGIPSHSQQRKLWGIPSHSQQHKLWGIPSHSQQRKLWVPHLTLIQPCG